VQLSWAAAAGATSYNVYVANSAGGEPVTPAMTGVLGTTVMVTKLTPGTHYYFTVKSIAASGISAASNEANAIPIAPAPTTNLQAIAGVASVNLTWSASSNATSYNVYTGTSAGGEATVATLSSITSSAATVSNLTPGTQYYFVVKALANGATSTASNEAAATPLTSAPPTAFAATPTVGGATFSWTASPGAGSYQLYLGTAAGAESAVPAQTALTGTSTTVSGLTAATNYYAALSSTVGGVASAYSNEVSFTTQSYAAPMGLTVTPSVGQIVVSWTASPGATGYSIYQGTAAGQEGSAAAQTVAETQAVFTGLTTATTYYFYVQASTDIGPSLPSTEVSGAPQTPAGPTNLAGIGGTNLVTLTWSATRDASSYDVYQGTAAGQEAATAVQTGITGVSTAISGLSAGTQYFYTVRAETAEGISAPSTEVSATTTAPVATTPPASTSPGGKSGGGAADGWSVAALGLLALLRAMRDRRVLPRTAFRTARPR
jgi:fibronectin type 3 domain-containing protein